MHELAHSEPDTQDYPENNSYGWQGINVREMYFSGDAMGDIVYNVDGTSRRKCVCKNGSKTWLAHWERGTSLQLPDKCCARYCSNYVEVGAHVKLEGGDGRITWIIPFCQHHNKRPSSQAIELKWDVTLCGAARNDCEA